MKKRKNEANMSLPRSTDSHFDPAHYPPGQLPALTSDELQAIAKKVDQEQLPTGQELDAALGERHRAMDKVEKMLVSNRPDANERVLSATGTVRATFSLDSFTVEGLNYRVRQAKNARSPKTPHFDKVIMAYLRGNPDANSKEIWDALSNYHQDDLKIHIADGKMEWDYMGTPESSGGLQFDSFKSKVSKLRKKTSRR